MVSDMQSNTVSVEKRVDEIEKKLMSLQVGLHTDVYDFVSVENFIHLKITSREKERIGVWSVSVLSYSKLLKFSMTSDSFMKSKIVSLPVCCDLYLKTWIRTCTFSEDDDIRVHLLTDKLHAQEYRRCKDLTEYFYVQKIALYILENGLIFTSFYNSELDFQVWQIRHLTTFISFRCANGTLCYNTEVELSINNERKI